MRRQLTAFGSGGAKLAEICRVSALLADDPEPEMPPWIWWGIFVHRYLEYSKTLGREKALEYIAKKCRRALKCCSAIDVASIPDGDVEVGYAHDTAARLARRIKWPEQPKSESEMYGKADLVVAGDVPHVVDYKTGGTTFDPRESSQLVGLAVARRIEAGGSGPVRVSVVGVCSSGQLLWRTEEIGAGEADAAEAKLVEVHKRVLADRKLLAEGVLPERSPGPHCESEWCPFQKGCALVGGAFGADMLANLA